MFMLRLMQHPRQYNRSFSFILCLL